MSEQIALIAEVFAKPGRRDELVAAVSPLMEAVATEPGTLSFSLHLDLENPDTVWFYETYADEAAFRAHAGTSTVREFAAKVRELTTKPSRVNKIRVVRSS